MILLYRTIRILINIIEISIVFRIVLSFLNPGNRGIFTRFVYEVTEPVLAPAKGLLDKLRINTGMFDFSPLVAILFLRIIQDLAIRILL